MNNKSIALNVLQEVQNTFVLTALKNLEQNQN